MPTRNKQVTVNITAEERQTWLKAAEMHDPLVADADRALARRNERQAAYREHRAAKRARKAAEEMK